MLTSQTPRQRGKSANRRDHGLVLLVVMLVLAAMSLAAIGLMRSSLTGNRIAGNLAFQQSATQSADAGIEAAIAWLETKHLTATGKAELNVAIAASAGTFGYSPTRSDPDPATKQTWEAWWTGSIEGSGLMNTLPTDGAGNVVQFVIHRLCANAGAPTSGAGCSVSPATTAQGSSMGAGIPPLEVATQVYYRVTARVVGPRNSVAYVQAVVAM